MGKIKRFLPLLLAIVLLLPLAACQTSENSYYEKSFFAMNTYMILRVDGESAEAQVAAAEEKIRTIENDLEVRVFTPTGLLSQLNAAEGAAVTVSDEIIALLQTALAANAETDGAFDITLFPLSELWDFNGEGHIPTAEELAATLKLTGCENVVIDAAAKTVRLENGAKIDLGAIAKGYTADVITSDLKADGVTSALLNFGGNIVAIGKRDSGEAWRVGVADPKNTTSVVGVLSISDQSVVTSAPYERYFMDGAMRYHHLLDPQTGKPARTGLESVTVVCDSSERADVLSTALFVMGEEKALEFWRSVGGFEMILIREDKTIAITEPLRAAFEETAGAGYKIEVVK